MAEQLAAHYLYFGDTARLPYGTKSAETVARYAIGAARFLEAQNIDLLVIACNTATALAFPRIQEAAHVPVVGVVEPGAAMAAELSKSRAAIVIATEATVSSHAYRDALQRHGVAAHEKACPLFVPLVEEGWIEHPVTEQVARIYLAEALGQAPQQADVLVLACTHYPLIAPLLRRMAPEHMQIVDSAESTARVVKKIIEEDVICHPEGSEDVICHPEGSEDVLCHPEGSEDVICHPEASEDVICHPERSEGASATKRSRRPPMDAKVSPAEHRTFRFYV